MPGYLPLPDTEDGPTYAPFKVMPGGSFGHHGLDPLGLGRVYRDGFDNIIMNDVPKVDLL